MPNTTVGHFAEQLFNEPTTVSTIKYRSKCFYQYRYLMMGTFKLFIVYLMRLIAYDLENNAFNFMQSSVLI